MQLVGLVIISVQHTVPDQLQRLYLYRADNM